MTTTLKNDQQHINFDHSSVFGNATLTTRDDVVVKAYFNGSMTYDEQTGEPQSVVLSRLDVDYMPEYTYEPYPATELQLERIEQQLKEHLLEQAAQALTKQAA